MRRSFAPLIAAGSGGFATSSVLLLAAFITNLDGWLWGDIMPRVAGSLVAAGIASLPIAVARRRMRLAGGDDVRAARGARFRFLGAMLLGTLLGPLGGGAVALLLLAVPPTSDAAAPVALLAAPPLGMALPFAVAWLVGVIGRGVAGRVLSVPGASTGEEPEPRATGAARGDAVDRDRGAIPMPAGPAGPTDATGGTRASGSPDGDGAWARARRGAAIGAMSAPIAAGIALVSTASTMRGDALLLAALPVSIVGAVLVGVTRQVVLVRGRRDVNTGTLMAAATAASVITLAVIALVSTATAGADATEITHVGPFRLVEQLPAVVAAFVVSGLGGGAVGLVAGPIAGAVTAAALARSGGGPADARRAPAPTSPRRGSTP